VLAGEATTVPKHRHTLIESLRVLRLARASAIKARTVALNQIKDLTVTAPEPLRSQLRPLTNRRRVTLAATWTNHGPLADPLHANRCALTNLAQRAQQLSREIRDLNHQISALVTAAAPRLLAHPGVGPDSAAQLLITAGANAHRIHNEPAFAALCGVSPVQASSGHINRHRLNRGGDRQANRALWVIAFTRLRYDERTKTYAARATTHGKNPKEIRRLLKRYIARELFPSLVADINALT
jgi:transposase